MSGVCVWIAAGETQQGSIAYNIIVTAVLFITILFANFAEAIAEAKGKAQANSLHKIREETPAKLVVENGKLKTISSSQLNDPTKLIEIVEIEKTIINDQRNTHYFQYCQKYGKIFCQCSGIIYHFYSCFARIKYYETA